MLRKIAIFNQKGGVGKTTTSVNLAAGLSRNNKRVILIDLDPQGDIKTCHTTDAQYNLYHFLMESAELKDCVTKLGKNLDIMHCDYRLAEAESQISKEKNSVEFLRTKLNSKLDYDYILLDCSPSWRMLNKNVLFYASEVIIPTSTDVLGFSSLGKTIRRIMEFNKENSHDALVSGVLPTLYDRRNKICVETLKKMKEEYSPLLVSEPIRVNSKLKEAPKAKKSIFAYDKRSSGAEDYWKFVKLILENEHMFDLDISEAQREKAINDYYVNGKKREMMFVGDKVTFGFKFIPNFKEPVKLDFVQSQKKNKKAKA